MPKRRPTFLITAGPTVEDIDPVRFISNRATGRLGVEIARAAVRRGYRVILIHGPLPETVQRAIPASRRLAAVPVRSAADMHRAVMKHVAAANIVVMNAAVADYTPARTARVKIRKSSRGLTLRLRPTVDILRQLGELKQRRASLVLIGFALETGAGSTALRRRASRVAAARRKIEQKNLDAIVLDTPAAMGAARGSFAVLPRAERERIYRGVTKRKVAALVVGLCERCLRRRWLKRSERCMKDVCRLNISFARAVRGAWRRRRDGGDKREVLLACNNLERASSRCLRTLTDGGAGKLRLLRNFLRGRGRAPS